MIALALLAAAALRPELAQFERLSGHCCVGQSPDGKPDTHCFTPVFDGVFLRDAHEVPGKPPYRGETLYVWNATAQRIDYSYVNSFGDEYRGSAKRVDGGIAFSFGEGKPFDIVWRWTGDGYTVSSGKRPPIAFKMVR